MGRLRQTINFLARTNASSAYRVVKSSAAAPLVNAWKHPKIAQLQQDAFEPLLTQMRNGNPRQDFSTLASAVSSTDLRFPKILEVGCGGGWNSEVLDRLLPTRVGYTGLDYSAAMIDTARRAYGRRTFLVGDAEALPFIEDAFQIVISGTVLMHLLDYRKAIQESCRVAGRYCIFHTVPVTTERETTVIIKKAYGQQVPEMIFNESELLLAFGAAHLHVQKTLDSLDYDLSSAVSIKTRTRTYVCELQK